MFAESHNASALDAFDAENVELILDVTEDEISPPRHDHDGIALKLPRSCCCLVENMNCPHGGKDQNRHLGQPSGARTSPTHNDREWCARGALFEQIPASHYERKIARLARRDKGIEWSTNTGIRSCVCRGIRCD